MAHTHTREMGINLADHFLFIVNTKKVKIRLETQKLNSGGIKYDRTSDYDHLVL